MQTFGSQWPVYAAQQDKDRIWPQYAPAARRRFAGSVIPVMCGACLLVGGGANLQFDRVPTPHGTGSVQVGAFAPLASEVEQGVATYMASVQESLKLSVADLAELFGVTRPTIYSWRNGNALSEVNASRVRAIATALSAHGALLSSHSGRIGRRAIEGRATAFDLLKQGQPPDDVIRKLADLLAQETAQRERLAQRLQGKTGSRGAADIDVFG